MSISLQHLVKRFDDHAAVRGLALEIEDGEFFVLLGPSGSGKSTVLRMIAGLTNVDAGRIEIAGKDVTDLPPQARRVGFVFQNYALFRQMTVAQNLDFALRIRRRSKADRQKRCEELLELVGLAGLGARYPRQLSGGQQQRVALARALACDPEVLLLDEPLGALDAGIRAELRRAIRKIQRELGIAAILVTHDQEEAFELGDRIGVMHSGRLLEVGRPDELYLRPQTEFVATFLGNANLLVGESVDHGVQLGPLHFPLGTARVGEAGERRRVQVLFRPEDVIVRDRRDGFTEPIFGEARVTEALFAGGLQRLRLELPKLPGVRAIAPATPFGADHMIVEATRPQDYALRFPLREGDRAWIGVRRIHALTHPGMSFLVVTNGSSESRGALRAAGRIARLAHARVTVLGQGVDAESLRPEMQELRSLVGSELIQEPRLAADPHSEAVLRETARFSYDLVVHRLPSRGGARLAERLLASGEHHLLLVREPELTPTRALLCVTVSEPAKEDVQFAGRLFRHLGAEATLLTVISDRGAQELHDRAERFLSASERTLALSGVRSRGVVRAGSMPEQVLAELRERPNDLLVLGVPLPTEGAISLSKPVSELLEETKIPAVLLVRSRAM